MKKIFKIFPFIFVFMIVSIIFVMLLSYRKPNYLKVLVCPYDYILCGKDENIIKTPIYSSIKENTYFNKDFIEEAYISSEEIEYLQVEILDFKYLDYATYNGDDYYEYGLELFVPLSCDDLVYMNNLKLVLNYGNNESLKFNLGSLTICNNENSGSLSYSSLKGYEKIINNKMMLSHVLVNLKGDKEYIIDNIYPIGCNVKVSKAYLIDNIDEVVDIIEKHNVFNDGGGSYNLKCEGDNLLLIELNYDDFIEVPILGFLIEYSDGENQKLIINPFRFYNNHEQYNLEEYVYEFN